MTLIVCPNCQQNIQGIIVHILAPFEDGECPHCGKGFVVSVAAQHSVEPSPRQSISEEDNDDLENMPLDPDKGG